MPGKRGQVLYNAAQADPDVIAHDEATKDTFSADTVSADKIHRGHAIIENVHADLKNSALAHLPSGTFTANAAWLVLSCIAFNSARRLRLHLPTRWPWERAWTALFIRTCGPPPSHPLNTQPQRRDPKELEKPEDRPTAHAPKLAGT